MSSKLKFAGLDIESVGTDLNNTIVWILSLNFGSKRWLIHDCFGIKKLPKDVINILEDETICKVIHNAAFDGTYLLVALGVHVRNIWCTQSAETVILGYSIPFKTKSEVMLTNYSVALEYVLPRYGFPKPDKSIRENFIDRPKGLAFTKAELKYASEDTEYLPKLQRMQEFLLERDELLEVALLENKTAEKIISMRALGIKVDQELWRKIAVETTKEYERRLAKLPKEVENWGSEKQVKKYFRSIGIDIPSYKELDEILIATKNKTLQAFMDAMELKKSVTTYGLNWLEDGRICNDGRIRVDVFQIKDTGRMSMSDGLHQLPKKGRHREAIIPERGNIFGIGDFSGQEMGIMAAMAEEKLWIDAMLRGDDVHAITAAMLFEADWESGYAKGCRFPKKCDCPVHADRREKTKTLNFMLAYGGGPLKFSHSTGYSFGESKQIIRRYKRIVPNVYRELELNGKYALRNGEIFSADPYRRRRVLLDDRDWHVVNQGKNTPIQAAGANMLKLAMISMPDFIPIAMVIHDEIITEQKVKLGPKHISILKNVMEKSADFITGIKGLIKVEPRLSYSLAKPKK